MIEKEDISKIEEHFKVPIHVQNKVKNVVEKVKGGYELIETRSRWDGSPGSWTRFPVAKIIFHQPSGKWKVYWQSASGAWNLYEQFKTLVGALRSVDRDKHGCFWG